MRPTEIEATKRHIAAWDLSPEQIRELQRLADHLLAERERLRAVLKDTALAVHRVGCGHGAHDGNWNECGRRLCMVARAALAESEAR
jgi:hypothetical protein